MNRLTISLDALHHNLETVSGWINAHGASWTFVSKALCGHSETLAALHSLGIRSIGDSRLMNLRAARANMPDTEMWYLRLPHLSAIESIALLSDVSLNSEIEVIMALNEEAERLGKVHRIIIMIELGDLREGILPGSLVEFYERIFQLGNIQVLGIGANLGCLSGVVPNVDQMMQLVLYKELLELKFEHTLPLISAGSSSLLPLLVAGSVPKAINHFRIGESLILGTDLVNGGTLEGLRDDVAMLEVEIAEIKEKGLVPLCETTEMTPFAGFASEDFSPGQRGYRALVTLGQLDTDISGLTSVNPDFQIAGASSDITVVNIGDSSNGLEVGDTLKFRVDYSGLVRLMNDKYIDKVLVSGEDRYTGDLPALSDMQAPPILASITREVD